MAILLSAQCLTHSFSVRPLFTGLTFSIESGDRIGLIGPNGAGKSTLLKIIAGQIAPDDGHISSQRGLRVGFLEQDPEFKDGLSIMDAILEGTDDPDDWESVARAEEYLSKFELDTFGAQSPVQSLSGGWRKRVALARELVREPDLLLLDEPTNHLDVESILWLEELLANARFATLTVTHDRLFLQRVSTRIIEIDSRHKGGLLSVKGDYASYLEARALLIDAQERREVILKNTLRRETEWLRRGAKARTTKQQARIQRHGELKGEVEDLNLRNQSRTAGINFSSSERTPKRLIEAKKISKSYGDRQIVAPLDLLITPGTRIGLMGQNGAGKSTLIRLLLGLEEPTSGRVHHSDLLSVAYFDQVREGLDPELTVSQTLCPKGSHVSYRGAQVHIRSYLDRFLFTQQQMDMPVGKLSGGEQSRILIARLMLTTANVLVLDEPTNDLDMATLSILEESLTEFDGAVILVTHDRYFLDQVATQILAFSPSRRDRAGDGKLTSFADLSQWERWHAQELRQRDSKTVAAVAVAAPALKKKLSFKDQRELDGMESVIHTAEERLAALTRESEDPAVLTNPIKLTEIANQMTRAQEEIDRLYERWAELGRRG